MNRRHFLKTTAAATAVGAVVPTSLFAAQKTAASSDVLIGSQLYGWGQYYQRAGKNASEHNDEIFSALRDAGYDYAEGNLDSGTLDNNAAFAEKLKAKGLRPVSLYTGGALHNDRAEITVENIVIAGRVCKEAGFQVINCNPDPIGREKTDAELATQVKALKQLGEELNKVGIKLGIHHHTPAMANGAREFHNNFDQTIAGTVGFCYDVHWVFRGGVQPADALRQYGDRVVSWHLRQSREGIWWEDLATGDIDYTQVAKYAQKNGLPPLYTVELAIEQGTKITRGVVDNHARSLTFVREVFVA
jgi:inosose dehydratase